MRQVQWHHGLATFHIQAERRELFVVDARVGGKQQSLTACLAPLTQRLDAAVRLPAAFAGRANAGSVARA